MSREEKKFRGFSTSAAKKRTTIISQLLRRTVTILENRDNVPQNAQPSSTSTPKSKSETMENHFNYNNDWNTLFHQESTLNFAMDYDSGYISHNPESNSDCSVESASTTSAYPFFSINPFYVSEDTLLEHPREPQPADNTEDSNFSSDSSSVVAASVETVKTQFSGFTNESDLSTEIDTVDEIVFKANDTQTDSFVSDASFMDISLNNSQLSENTTSDNQTLTFNDSLINPNDISISSNLNNLMLANSSPSRVKTAPQATSNVPAASMRSSSSYGPAKDSLTPTKANKVTVNPNFSPDLFEGCENVVESERRASLPSSFIADEKYVIKKDHKLIKRVQNGLNGVPPPPNVTIVQISVNEILNKIESNKQYFWNGDFDRSMEEGDRSLNSSAENEEFKSLMVTVDKAESILHKRWPHVLEDRFHGLHYNRSKLSEEFELLCEKFAQRCIGAETQSTCTVFDNTYISPSKRKAQKQRWSVKSPSRRLSHLARRRITFSSANLQGSGATLGSGNRTRQILVDAKKLELLRRKSPRKSPRKTPKKTPSKSPRCKTKTPSSSAKKKLAMRFRKVTGEIENAPSTSANTSDSVSSKRALFQSPDRTQRQFLPSTSSSTVLETSSRKMSLKRALFSSPRKTSPFNKRSPFKKSPFKLFDNEKKRKRNDSEDERCLKFARSVSCTLEMRPSVSEMKTLNRTRSDANLKGQTSDLSEVHKKKLQWAVYEALKTQNVTATHPQFKVFASILARVTRKFLPNLGSNMPRPEGGTSDRMFRIARHHVYAVVKGKSVEEIIGEYLKSRKRQQKPQGYVAIEDFNKSREADKENVNVVKSSSKSSSTRKNVLSDNQNIINENRVDRIRKVINFGDDENR